MKFAHMLMVFLMLLFKQMSILIHLNFIQFQEALTILSRAYFTFQYTMAHRLTVHTIKIQLLSLIKLVELFFQ